MYSLIPVTQSPIVCNTQPNNIKFNGERVTWVFHVYFFLYKNILSVLILKIYCWQFQILLFNVTTTLHGVSWHHMYDPYIVTPCLNRFVMPLSIHGCMWVNYDCLNTRHPQACGTLYRTPDRNSCRIVSLSHLTARRSHRNSNNLLPTASWHLASVGFSPKLVSATWSL